MRRAFARSKLERALVISGTWIVVTACGGRAQSHGNGSSTRGGSSGGAGDSGGSAANGGTATGGLGAGGGSGGSGGFAMTGGSSDAGDGTMHDAGAGAGGASECVAAVRLDQCCGTPMPISRVELMADPCWAEWPSMGSRPTQNLACPTMSCPGHCPPVALPSHALALDTTGACQFVSECQTADDCGAFRDATECCDCAAAFPRSFATTQACLVGQNEMSPAECASCQSGDCATTPASCASQPIIVCKMGSDRIARCVMDPVTALPSGRCAAEQPCPGDTAGTACDVCFAPGDVACGGTAPPPGDCKSDVDCTSHGANYICQAAPCANPTCVEGCTATSCGTSEVCGADYRCGPKPCDADPDCATNYHCQNGTCERRVCALSVDCDPYGYCVNGICYESPGTCDSSCKP